VTAACKQYGGFYLGSIGGVAANLASTASRRSRRWNIPSLAWKRFWRIDVVDFPAFIVVDDKATTSSRN